MSSVRTEPGEGLDVLCQVDVEVLRLLEHQTDEPHGAEGVPVDGKTDKFEKVFLVSFFKESMATFLVALDQTVPG